MPQVSLAYSLIVIRTVSTGASNAVLTDFATRRMSSAFCASLRPVIIFIETIGIEPALLVRHMEVDRPQVLDVEREALAGVDRHGPGDAAGKHDRTGVV